MADITAIKTELLSCNYGLTAKGKTGTYFSSVFNEEHEVVLSLTVTREETGEIIYSGSFGNCFCYRENFDRTIGNFLFWLSWNSLDKYELQEMVEKLFWRNNNTLFNRRMETERRKQSEQKETAERLAADAEKQKEFERHATNFGYTVFYGLDATWLLTFSDDRNLHAWERLADEQRGELLEKNIPGIVIALKAPHSLLWGIGNTFARKILAEAIEFISKREAQP